MNTNIPSNPVILTVPDGWTGTVDDQNELFTHILTRYLWMHVSRTLPLCGVTLEKWRRYAPQYMRMYWGSMGRVYRECLDTFGVAHGASYTPIMAIYDWEALYSVATMQTRFCDEPQHARCNIPPQFGITLDYRWDIQYGVAIMCVKPQDIETRRNIVQCLGYRYACVDELLDFIFILDDTPDELEQIL